MYVPGFYGETKPVEYTHTHSMGRFIIGICSHNYGGQKVPPSAVCNLESEEADGVTPSLSQNAENQDSGGGAAGVPK